jgi:hypothetical protein
MEREYIVAFIIILSVVVVGLLIVALYYPKLWQDINSFSDMALGKSKEKENKEFTQHNIKQVISALSQCKTDNFCTCNIKDKRSLPTDYHIFFRPIGKEEMLIYGFDSEGKIIQLTSEQDALKLKGIKLGLAVFARPEDPLHFSKKEVLPFAMKEASSEDVDYRGIYCYFGTIGKDNKYKPVLIDIEGDEDGDWSFSLGPTSSIYKSERSGFLLDQIGDQRSDAIFNTMPNILKLDNDKYCILTTSILEYRYDKEFVFGDNDDVVYISAYNWPLLRDHNDNVIKEDKKLIDFVAVFKARLPPMCS